MADVITGQPINCLYDPLDEEELLSKREEASLRMQHLGHVMRVVIHYNSHFLGIFIFPILPLLQIIGRDILTAEILDEDDKISLILE